MRKPQHPSSPSPALKRGPWTPEEDELLSRYVAQAGEGRWRTLPKRAGLLRCGKSCRLRWMNYLRPSIKHGRIAPDEEDLILRLHRLLGNRWSLIAGRIPGRTDNEIKNYWNTHLSKKLISQGIDPRTHKPLDSANPNCSNERMPPPANPNLDAPPAAGVSFVDADVDGDFASFFDSLMNEDMFMQQPQGGSVWAASLSPVVSLDGDVDAEFMDFAGK